MPTSSAADITVVYPAFEIRGSLSERLRTWACDQTLARDRYRIVVGIDSASPSQAREAEALLSPQDEIIAVPDVNEGVLWNAGAARAGTRWLVIAEGHCLAAPNCLEAVARWIAANPDAEAGNFAVDHTDDHLMSRLSRRWFDQTHQQWKSPSTWPRLHRAGFAIRADAFNGAGGFEPRYGQFSAPMLSARLHKGGVRIDTVPDAAVIHMDDATMDGHHFDTADFAVGECEARTRNDPDFFERYFGRDPLYSPSLNGRRVAWRMLQAALIACASGREHAKALAPLLPRYAMLTMAGVKPRIAFNRLAVKLDEFAVDRLPLPSSLRWARFIRAHRRVVDLTRLQWAANRSSDPLPPAPWSFREIAETTPDTLIGAHSLEEHGGRRFRWTEPVALLRLAPSAAPRVLRIETAGLRGDPLASVRAVVVDGRALPADALARDEHGTLTARLPAGGARASTEVAIVSTPLIPADSGIADSRWLGLPVFSIAIDSSAAPRTVS